jgi:hypothetical protein
MNGRATLAAGVVSVFTLLAGCSGSTSGVSSGASGGGQITLSMRDKPPSGISVLSFEISVTGATLQPQDTTKAAVSLLTNPVGVEVKQLETETAFLNTSSAPVGTTFSSITVTFANPLLTILNNSGQMFVVNGQTCPNGQICALQPPLNLSSVTFTAAPFPLMLNMNSPIGLVLDFDLNGSIQSNLSITPTLTFTQLPAVLQTAELEDIEDLIGTVTALGTNQFMLKNATSGLSFSIAVNSSTQFEFAGCAANNFSCIAVGQVLEVNLSVLGNGSFVAKKVMLEGDANEQEVEGTVTSVNAAGSQFHMVVVEEEPVVANVSVGDLVTVNIQGGANFQIDQDDLNISSGLSFASANDVVVGQNILVRANTVTPGPISTTITTSRLRLRMSQFTAPVASVAAPNFVVNGLPSLFISNGVNQLQVQTSSRTEFEAVTGVTALKVSDTVSLRGLLFGSSGEPVLVAKKVRKR